MIKSKCLDEFIDVLSTEFPGPVSFNAFQVAKFCEDESGIYSIKELNGGCTNSAVVIEFDDGCKVKMTIFLEDESPYKVNNLDSFFIERTIKNSLYKDEFNIIYNANPRIIVSEYIEGESLDNEIKQFVNNKKFYELSDLNCQVISAINEFHNNSIRTHCTTISSLAMTFFSSLKKELNRSIYFDVDLRSTKFLDDVHCGIGKILLFESGFDDKDFVLSHLDTDPVNILKSEDGVHLIDFEFAGIGLKYYDYVNYLNALDYLHLSKCNLEEKFEIHKNFIHYCQQVIPGFNSKDFQKSYELMRFVWGMWYIMYGLKNELKDYIKIGKEWIYDWMESD